MKRLMIALAFVSLAYSATSGQQPAPAVTFSKDVAPILQKACQNCHRPGAIAPMSLLTYQDARPWARSIKQKVTAREMPPWYIDRHVGITKFKDDPSLSEAEIATIVAWVDQGAPAGSARDLPEPRTFSDVDKWHIGKPDMIVSLPKPYELKANGPDEFYDVDVDPGFTEDMYISAVETKPEPYSFKVVHHATANMIEDEEEDPVGFFFNEYALGKNGDLFPEDSGRLIRAGSKIHFNLHLHPSGERSLVNISIGFKRYPKGKVPKHVAFTQHMGDNNDIDISPGQIVRTDGYFRLPKPAVLSAYQPHMHNRGKAMCMEAIYPDIRADSARPGPARTETLSCVSNYQFGWHITYPYADDVAPILPAGTIIHITAWHDNTAANKYNPNPRNWVGYGQRTIDEMSFAWVSLFYIDDAEYQQRVADRKKLTNE
ncbi:MAG: heme-binding domain-containing protein [Acidobacteriia bacterium]|nr:heme-binding domain-containing protein [Terriglobia bacterium]